MFNPYIGAPYIDSADALMERKDQLRTLRFFFQNRSHAVLFGPEGSGKSTLLRCFFHPAFLRQMARKNILIYQGEFPANLGGEQTYAFFADAIRASVEFLDTCGMEEDMQAMLRNLGGAHYANERSRFDQYLNIIQRFGFRMVIVLDNFENFTSSPNVKPEHHDLLCGMLNDDKLQLIVATNYDFNETSLPVGTRNSKLLTRLSPNSIHMTPLSPEACRELLDRVAEDAFDDFRFTDDQLQLLHQVSGGIPMLLFMAAKQGFALAETGDFAGEVLDRTLREARHILRHWCTVTPREQLDLLGDLRENRELSEDERIDASALLERGLLRKGFVTGRDGHPIPTEGYVYNSGLFREFCSHREWLDEILEKNPLRKEEEPAAFGFNPMDLLNGGGVTFNVGSMTLHQGDSYDNRGGNIVTYQPTVIADKGFARLFDLLDLKGEDLGSKLLEIFDSTPKALPGVVDADQVAEETAERITTMFIPEEIESEKLEECREEQKTLEAKFRSVRANVDPDGLLTDELLDSLSTKCRLYLQIAFVVDDALAPLLDFHLGDLSAQMVMYGKVLEQQLKDNFYPLFRKEAQLKHIDPFSNFSDPGSRNSFAVIKLNKTTIGNYMSMLRGQSGYLGNLCSGKSLTLEGMNLDSAWWRKLGDDVDDARNLRNGGDHAGSETSQSDLESMRKLLFGNGRILHRCGVGDALREALWPAAPAPAVDDKAAMVGQIVEMTNIQVTPRNSVRGTIVGTNYGVSISKKNLEDRKCKPHILLGKTIQVKLVQWDNNPTAQKFNAELV